MFLTSLLKARGELESSAGNASALKKAIVAGDQPAAKTALTRLQNSARSAHDHSDGPLWWLAKKAPVIGDDFASVSLVADVLDDVAHEVMPPLVDIATDLDLNTFAPHDGKIDLKALSALHGPIKEADARLSADRARLDAIHLADVGPYVQEPVASFKEKMAAAADATSIANDVLRLLPQMLGGPERSYLVAFQNNAEVRSTGGIPGAFLIVKVDHGKLTLGPQGTAGDLGIQRPIPPVTAEEDNLYSARLTKYPADATLTPEFPRTAEILKAAVKKSQHVDIDGVVSVDPVAMSYLLRGTGAVTVDGRRITAGNAVDELLNRAYLRLDALGQNEFFAKTAAKVFKVVTSGKGDAAVTVRGMVRAAKEHRVLVWSGHADEQQELRSMSVSATLGRDTKTQPTLGVYLNDAVGAKLDYYLDYDTSVASMSCGESGAQRLKATVRLTSSVPKKANGLPKSILGLGTEDDPGVIKMNLRLYLPTGGRLLTADLDGAALGTGTRMHKTHPVATVPIELEPGQTQRVTMTFDTAPGQARTVRVRTTPGVQPGANLTVQDSDCQP